MTRVSQVMFHVVWCRLGCWTRKNFQYVGNRWKFV